MLCLGTLIDILVLGCFPAFHGDAYAAPFPARECIPPLCTDRAAFLWPKGDLPQLTALLAQVNAVVGGDTGPVHIAAALGTPTVSFYRVTDARRNGPCGRQHRTLQAPLSCSPCLQKRCRRDLECSLAIPVATVFEALSDLLSQPAPPDQ
jgi:heptosyltransferase I